jgi:hypothetical protein
MFGSLVVVFPSRHEGGALILRHGGQEWTFDSAEAVRAHDGPALAYIAFYSDVEHEVTVVRRGYRVTLTYNLCFSNGDTLSSLAVSPVAPDDHVFGAALDAALKNPAFLSEGGILGFGLAFLYPVSPDETVLSTLLHRLKGSYTVIKRVCNRLCLDASLKAIYAEDSETIMLNELYDMGIARLMMKRSPVTCETSVEAS